MDDLETAADEPLSSDLVRRVMSNEVALTARMGMVLSALAPQGLDPATDLGLLLYPMRRALPVDFGGMSLTYHLQVQNFDAVNDIPVFFQVGGGGKEALYQAADLGGDTADCVSVLVPAAFNGWLTGTLAVRDVLDAIYAPPLRYPGFTTFGFFKADAAGDLKVYSLSVWGPA